MKMLLLRELAWLRKSRRTISFLIVGALFPVLSLIPGVRDSIDNIMFNDVSSFIILFFFGLIASLLQYLIDSTIKDKKDKKLPFKNIDLVISKTILSLGFTIIYSINWSCFIITESNYLIFVLTLLFTISLVLITFDYVTYALSKSKEFVTGYMLVLISLILATVFLLINNTLISIAIAAVEDLVLFFWSKSLFKTKAFSNKLNIE